MSRYQEVFRLDNKLYSEGCPVIIEVAVLQKDTQTGRILAQIKLRNISDKIITACKIKLRAFETNGNELDSVDNFSYLDLNAAYGYDFGSKTPVYLPDNTTRQISISIFEVDFKDNTIWTSNDDILIPIPTQKYVKEVFSDPEILKQYQIEVGINDSIFYPVSINGLFLCTCGTINSSMANKCFKCSRKREDLLYKSKFDYLTKNKDLRLLREQAQREEAARIAFEKEKEKEKEIEENRERKEKKVALIKKIITITIPILLIISIISIITPTLIIPSIKKQIAYNEANALLQDGLYDEAKTAFETLGEYKDASNMALESIYQKADNYNSNGDYENAIAVWNDIESYSDSSERIIQAELDWKEEDYQKAIELMTSEKYEEASAAFEELDGYKDSNEKSAECIELKKETDYQDAINASMENKYEYAINIFKSLSGYKEADELYVSTSYEYACKLAEEGNYKSAIKFFENSKGYEDTNELIKDAIYNYGCKLLNSHNYEDAISQFKRCSGYKDTAALINDAKYGYASGHKSNSNTTTYK